MAKLRRQTSPARARSLHGAMDAVSSPCIRQTLTFTSSDTDEKEDEDERENQDCNGRDVSRVDTLSESSKAAGGSFRYRTRRMERRYVSEKKKDLSYRRRARQRRSSSEQSTPTSHRLTRCTRSVSPPCASPATLLSCKLGAKLSMTSPMAIRLRSQSVLVLKRLNVVDCMNHFVTSFEDLQIIRWLGAGVSAEVYKARDLKSGELFAIKKSKQELRNERERDLLLQEIVSLEKLITSQRNFDHIVRYYQAWQENDFFFLQMELCEGGTLQDFTLDRNRETLPEKYLWHMIRDVATGLNVLHDHDIVHLDIKPDNIFITKDGKLKIGDFGMAGKVVTTSQSSSQTGELEGDAKYIAKELLSSAVRLPSADIFCLGIMMLEIATGVTLPESGKDWHDLREGDLPPFTCGYTEELQTMIRQMMHPDAAKRPSAAAILTSSSLTNQS